MAEEEERVTGIDMTVRSGRKNEMIYVNGAISELEQDEAMMERALLGVKLAYEYVGDEIEQKALKESIRKYVEQRIIEFPIVYEDAYVRGMPYESITCFAQFLVSAGENVEQVRELMTKADDELFEFLNE